MKRCTLHRKTPMSRGRVELPPKPERQSRVIGLGTARQTVNAIMAAAIAGEAVRAVAKDEPVRSEPYRRYVAGLACFACGLAGRSQAAHSNSPDHGKGLGLKAGDRYVFPLCCSQPGRVGCHTQHDLLIGMSRDDRRAAEVQYVDRMHTQARADGWDLETLRRKAHT